MGILLLCLGLPIGSFATFLSPAESVPRTRNLIRSRLSLLPAFRFRFRGWGNRRADCDVDLGVLRVSPRFSVSPSPTQYCSVFYLNLYKPGSPNSNFWDLFIGPGTSRGFQRVATDGFRERWQRLSKRSTSNVAIRCGGVVCHLGNDLVGHSNFRYSITISPRG